MSAAAPPPAAPRSPRLPHRGLGRRLVQVYWIVPACVVAASLLHGLKEVSFRASQGSSLGFALAGLLLGGLSGGVFAGPLPLTRFDAARAGRLLLAPCLGGCAGMWLASWTAPPWLEENAPLSDILLLTAQRGSLVGLGLTATLSALAAAPLLLVRRLNAQLEWQAGAVLVAGLGACLALGADRLGDEGARPLVLAAAVLPLAAASYAADRWAFRSGNLSREPLRGWLGAPRQVLGWSAAAWIVAAALCQGLGPHVLAHAAQPLPSSEVEASLLACRDALEEHRRSEGSYPSCLAELPGVEEELATGLKGGYAVRYVASKDHWILGADPVVRDLAGHAHYRLDRFGDLERAYAPFGLALD